jgi:acetyl-CoA/propionyl-CoA carboxylase biotin carboxyl carrier protein
MTAMFDTVLVANRGEIAVRVMRTLRRLGVRSVAVYSDADADALHVASADVAVRLGPAPASESYLDVERVIAAALASQAQAIHPGYGFLSENPRLAEACDANGIVFVGPPVSAIVAMGDKIAAKATVAAAGVAVVPGSSGAGLADEALAAAARQVGFPVLLKPSAGGGGKGMRLVEHAADLGAAIASARREARGAFGDDTLLVERFVRNPRHIEIQVLADRHGNVVHFGERECSLQRRHQKIVEEAPSPLLSPELRATMGRQAVDAARACGYVGAGTVEMIVAGDDPHDFFFMEMNTRLQVEHPVTEMVYGVDLVEWQLRVACGEPLPFVQESIAPSGHAVEARLYAEDPRRGFLPTGGRVHALVLPEADGIRVDAGIAAGSYVGSDYDPMLAKLIAWGLDRRQALHRLDHALAETSVLGITTNVGFLRRLLSDPDVVAGRLDTGLVERRLDELTLPVDPLPAIACVAIAPLVAAGGGAWSQLVGWRHGRRATTRRQLAVAGGDMWEVGVTPVGDGAVGGWEITVADRPPVHATYATYATGADGRIRLTIDGSVAALHCHRAGRTWYVSHAGETWTIVDVVQRGAGADPARAHGDGVVRSPMPGSVIAVDVEPGQQVVAGQQLVVVEAMKMEHSLPAATAGVVAEVHVGVGASVTLDQPLVTVRAIDTG